MGDGNRAVAWRQVSHLLSGWWRLRQSSRASPAMGAGSSSFAVAALRREGHRMCPGVQLGSVLGGSPPERPVTHLFSQLVWFAPVPI